MEQGLHGESLVESLRSLIDGNDCIIVFDQDGCVAFACSGIQLLLGSDPADYLGRTYLDPSLQLFESDGQPLDAQTHPFTRARLSLHPIYDRRLSVVGPSGDHIMVSANALPLSDGNGQFSGAGLSLTQTTEAYGTPPAVTSNELSFGSALDWVAIGVILADLDGKPIHVNSHARKMLGYTEEELRGMPFADFTHPDDLEMNVDLFKELRGGKRDSYSLEKRYITKAGDVVWANLHVSDVKDSSGRPLHAVVIVEDITERKGLEHALRQSEHRYKTLAEAAQDSIFIYGDGGFQYVNPSCADLFERTPEDVIGMSHHDLLPAELADKLDQRARTVLESGQQAAYETLLEVSGRPLWNHTVIVPLKDENGQVDAVMGVSRNITQRKQAEGQINQFQKTLLALPASLRGIEFGDVYQSSAEAALVGGDFYDMFQLDSGAIGIVIGDVSGKGIPAATLALQVKSTIRAYSLQGDDPATVMSKVSQVIESSPDTGPVFATAFFGILDPSSGQLTYCSAGHPEAIIKNSASKVFTLHTRSPLMGLSTDLTFSNEEFVLEQSQILVLYTDGITEARKEDELFGGERLLSLVSSIETNTRGFSQEILSGVSAFTDGPPSDDLAVLTVSLSDA